MCFGWMIFESTNIDPNISYIHTSICLFIYTFLQIFIHIFDLLICLARSFCLIMPEAHWTSTKINFSPRYKNLYWNSFIIHFVYLCAHFDCTGFALSVMSYVGFGRIDSVCNLMYFISINKYLFFCFISAIGKDYLYVYW